MAENKSDRGNGKAEEQSKKPSPKIKGCPKFVRDIAKDNKNTEKAEKAYEQLTTSVKRI